MEDNEIISKAHMPEHSEDYMEASVAGWQYSCARVISAVCTPFFIPVTAFGLLFFFTYLSIMPIAYKLTIISMVVSFTVLLPMLGIYMLRKVNKWQKNALDYKENRILPYGMTILCYTTCLLTMHNMHLPHYMMGIIISILICMILCTIINLKWKISTHMASCGLLIGGLVTFSNIFFFNPAIWLSIFILISGLVGTSRIIVRKHTLGEVAVGFFAGLLCGMSGILYIYL